MTTTTQHNPLAAFTDAELQSEVARRNNAKRKTFGAGPGRPASRYFVVDTGNGQNPAVPRYWIVERGTGRTVDDATTRAAAVIAARQWNAQVGK